jgi:hypothetical protein
VLGQPAKRMDRRGPEEELCAIEVLQAHVARG